MCVRSVLPCAAAASATAATKATAAFATTSRAVPRAVPCGHMWRAAKHESAELGCACSGCCTDAAPVAEEVDVLMHTQHAWVGAVIPLAGRSAFFDSILTGILSTLVINFFQWLGDRCCRAETKDAQRLRDIEEEAAIRRRAQEGGGGEQAPPRKGPTAQEVVKGDSESTWANAAAALGWGPCGALLAALLRLLLFHWLQPAVYLAGLFAFWADLGFWQAAFAAIVAVRELPHARARRVLCAAGVSAHRRAGWVGSQRRAQGPHRPLCGRARSAGGADGLREWIYWWVDWPCPLDLRRRRPPRAGIGPSLRRDARAADGWVLGDHSRRIRTQ